MACIQLSVVMVTCVLFQLHSGEVLASTFTLANKCSYTVWPGILSSAGSPPLSTTGFILQPGQSTSVSVPTSWSGRLWGRTLCTQNSTTSKFSCITGDCGSSTIECSGGGAIPPATLAEFTLNGAGGLDFFDVSLVDGYNLPIMVAPQAGTRENCKVTGCAADLNQACPTELKVIEGGNGGKAVACKSACEAFGDPQYCCSGAFSTPDKCKPSSYSTFFKNGCPKAYSYAYDDGTSTFTCAAAAEYVISFCPDLDHPDTSIIIPKSFNGSTQIAMEIDAVAGSHHTTPGFTGNPVVVLAITWWLSQLSCELCKLC